MTQPTEPQSHDDKPHQCTCRRCGRAFQWPRTGMPPPGLCHTCVQDISKAMHQATLADPPEKPPRRAHKPRASLRGVGVHASRAKLDDDKVREIRELYRTGTKQTMLAKRYGVSQGTIGMILTGRTWRHVK